MWNYLLFGEVQRIIMWISLKKYKSVLTLSFITDVVDAVNHLNRQMKDSGINLIEVEGT